MRRLSTTLAASGMVTVVLAGPAAAHSGIMPSRMAPETTEAAELMVVHGCGEDGTVPGADDPSFATTAVTLRVPDGVVVVPQAAEGWTLDTDVDETGRVVEARWGSVDPAGTLETIAFDLDITIPDVPDGTQVWLPVIQDCTDGEQMAWVHEGTDGGEVHPATLLTVAQPVGAASQAGGGLPTPVLVALVLALGVVAGGAAFVLTGRRG